VKKNTKFFMILITSLFFTNNCTHLSVPPISGKTVANKRLQYDVYQTILKNLESKKCQKIESIAIKYTSSVYVGERWSFNACNKNYYTTITYRYNKEKKKTSYSVQPLKEEKTKKYHAKIYTLREYKKKLPTIEINQVLFDKDSLKYLTKGILPKRSTNSEFGKSKTIYLDKKYHSFKNIKDEKTFFNKFPIDKLSAYELETIIYYDNKALVTFSSIGDYSFFRGYYLLILKKGRLISFNLGFDQGCGSPIEMPYLLSEGSFLLPKPKSMPKKIKKKEYVDTVTLDNIPLPSF